MSVVVITASVPLEAEWPEQEVVIQRELELVQEQQQAEEQGRLA